MQYAEAMSSHFRSIGSRVVILGIREMAGMGDERSTQKTPIPDSMAASFVTERDEERVQKVRRKSVNVVQSRGGGCMDACPDALR